jgi:diguanylate cyclase (GGDEF)-like protein
MSGGTHTTWSSLQLAEFLSVVTSFADEASAHDRAIEEIAAALEAEVVAVVRGGAAVTHIGFGSRAAPLERLAAIAAERPEVGDLPHLGLCHVRVLDIDADTAILVGRAQDPFDAAELTLLEGMVKVLALSLRPLRQLEVERGLRLLSQGQARENERLLAAAATRQEFTERLYRIQRAISTREPLKRVFEEVVATIAAVIADETVVLRLIDEVTGRSRVVASSGYSADLLARRRVASADRGMVAAVIAAQDLVVAEDYPAHPAATPELVAAGMRSAMSAPIAIDGRVVAVLTVGTTSARRYDEETRAVLRILAEQLSVALNDVRTAEAMRVAYDEAVHQATHDPLTGLPNRKLVTARLDQALAAMDDTGRVAVMFVDLDRFKAVNDSSGHDTGDLVLEEVARRLQACARAGDTVGRLSGDEFVVVAPGLDDVEAQVRGQGIVEALAEPVQLGTRELVVTASVGVAVTSPGDDAESILRDADVAMYEAKQAGRSRAQIFDRGMRTRVLRDAEIEQALRLALRRDELRLHYQPIVDARTGAITSLEALLRWQRPDRLVPPDEFIPIAEETGLIVGIGDWVLQQGCADIARLRATLPGAADLRLNLNFSGRQITGPSVVDSVGATLRANRLPASALVIELTESTLVDRGEEVRRTLQHLGDMGVRLAIDDFGTGYSSLLYLKRFPVAQLKIDRRFTAGLGEGGEDDAIVRAITGLARALRIDVVAEGVETVRQAETLGRLGCGALQGYLLARPAPLEDLDLRPTRLPSLGWEGAPAALTAG